MSRHETIIVKFIASACDARKRCLKNGNEYAQKWDEQLDAIDEMLPSGSGFDSGSKIDREKTTTTKIVIETAYHHMNESGFYDGWTEHIVTIVPDLALGFTLKISGRNKNDVKDYIAESFGHCLGSKIDWNEAAQNWRLVQDEYFTKRNTAKACEILANMFDA